MINTLKYNYIQNSNLFFLSFKYIYIYQSVLPKNPVIIFETNIIKYGVENSKHWFPSWILIFLTFESVTQKNEGKTGHVVLWRVNDSDGG